MVVYKAHKKLDNKTIVFVCFCYADKYHEKELKVGPGGGCAHIYIYTYNIYIQYIHINTLYIYTIYIYILYIYYIYIHVNYV